MVKWVVDLQELGFPEVEPLEFYRDIFGYGNLEKKGEYVSGAFTGIACEIFKETKPNGKRFVKRYSITDELSTIKTLLKSDKFVILSPISYIGKERLTANARVMHAFAIEIDNLIVNEKTGNASGLKDLLHWMKMGHKDKTFIPQANYIVCSGSGVHLYYVFERPLYLYPNVKKSLQMYKQHMTPKFWNRYITYSYRREDIQNESVFQGFRLVGGVTKNGERTRVFKLSDTKVTVDYMNSFVTYEDEKYFIKPIYQSTYSLKEAKEKFPEWYQDRVVEGKPKGTWICKRALYDWWKRRIFKEAQVGHRYYCLYLLSVYAIKCDISREELEKDAYELLDPFDAKSEENTNRFTEKDVNDALQAFYDKGLVTYPISSIQNRSGLTIEKNKRNFRKQRVHLQIARATRDIIHTNWREGNGRKAKKAIVEAWREANPTGKKADCIRDTGLSKPTVYKWWS